MWAWLHLEPPLLKFLEITTACATEEKTPSRLSLQANREFGRYRKRGHDTCMWACVFAYMICHSCFLCSLIMFVKTICSKSPNRDDCLFLYYFEGTNKCTVNVMELLKNFQYSNVGKMS